MTINKIAIFQKILFCELFPFAQKQMAIKLNPHFIHLSSSFIYSFETKQKYRVHKNDFTRIRKLPFEELVLCMLKLLRHTIQKELNSFLKEIQGSTGSAIKKISSSAFVQSRKKLKPDMFFDLNNLIATDYYIDNDEKVKLYKGLRILSIDGSSLNLPVTEELKNSYGVFNNQSKTNDVIIARVSVLYDVLNELILDGKLCPFSTGEVPLSRSHCKYASKGDLIIMDRAYPSFESAYLMQQQGIDFLFRCKHSFSNQVKSFYESGKREYIMELKPKENQSFTDLSYDATSVITVRMLRIELPSGETEILMTSLLDTEKHPYKDFKELYFKRWKVETFYNRFKNIIGVECFSGTSNQFIQQEFNCALYVSNMQTILTEDAQMEADKKYQHRKYEYKINSSLSLGFIRERLVKILSKQSESQVLLKEMEELFTIHVIPIRPGRNNIRNPGKYRRRSKPKQFKNRRIVL